MSAPMLPFEETVSEAAERMILERTRPGGVRCPCCTQLVSLRAVSISKSMARGLVYVYAAAGFEWCKPIDVLCSVNTITHKQALCYWTDLWKLRYWGLVKPARAGDRPEGKPLKGMARVLPPAGPWIHEESTVPRQAMTFDRHSYGYKDETDRIKITDVLPFDLGPLLVGVPPYGGPGPPEAPRWPVG